MRKVIHFSADMLGALHMLKLSAEESDVDALKRILRVPIKEPTKPKPKGQPGRKSEFGFERLNVGQYKTIEVDDSQGYGQRYKIVASVRNMSRNGRKYVLSWPTFNVAHVLRVS